HKLPSQGLNPHKPPRAAVPKPKRRNKHLFSRSPNNVSETGYENLIAPLLSSQNHQEICSNVKVYSCKASAA
ncbi:hypothetical protein H0E87_029800, partial [Populus deltoides]